MDNPPPMVLVVDDDADVRRALVARFEGAGLRIRAVSGGEEALGACEREHPDVVILDVSMPGMDGYQVCERLRERFEAPMAVIFLTGAEPGRSADAVAPRVQGSGGDYFVLKPYDAQYLVGLVKRIIGEWRETSVSP